MISTLKYYSQKVRIWGLRGVWNFFVGKIETRRLRSYFFTNASKYPTTPATTGFTIVAPFHDKNSLSKVIRDLTFSFHDAGIPFQTFDTSKKNSIQDSDIDALLTPSRKFRILKYSNLIELFSCPIPPELRLKSSHVVFWEFESGLLEAFPALRSADTVIAMSDFNAAYFQRILPPTVKVAKLLYPFRFSPPTLPPPAQTRRRFGIGVNDFAVFFNFDYGSSFFRKNPDGAIRAFAKAFRDTPDAKLVFKTNRAKDFPKVHASLRDLAATLGITAQFISIDNFLPRDDVYAITAASNIYLSLHRGEGFGLGIAEAMSLGKPAIVTDYGGSTEFCIPETAILIPYSKRTLHHGQMDNPCYHDVDFCAEPDIDSAAKAMRRCYESREICLDIGLRAKRFVEAHFSAEQFRKSLAALMKGFRVDG